MDKNYWEEYYQIHGNDKGIAKHSTFSEFCLNKHIKETDRVVEIGSGNGRDAIFFAHHCEHVVAIDQSTTAIDIEKKAIFEDVSARLLPLADDFTLMDFKVAGDVDVIYSRFTLHAITSDDEKILLPRVYDSLNDGGLFCIEARTVNDPLFGTGKKCGGNTYLTDHKRRFIDSMDFLRTVISMGFSLRYFTEENNLSVYKDDNPVLMRAILQK